jgi:cytochrome c oxidase subunit 2
MSDSRHTWAHSRGLRAPLRRRFLIGLSALLTLALTACGSNYPSFLRSSGPDAAWQRGLWWILFAISAVIFFEVILIMGYGAWRKPSAAEQEAHHDFGTPLLWIGGIILPLIILATVLGLTVDGMLTTSDPPANLTIEVVGHQWWWEVRYPSEHIITANEIHIPVGQPVRVELTSADVIHDFWVPQISGKIDAIPGETNTIQLEASTAGNYRGECLVYCGLQHANMNFLVVAQSPSDYDAWVSTESAPPAPPATTDLIQGQQIFLSSSCVYCHTVAGTSAQGTTGPDLTHIGSRQYIAAGVLPNNPGTLGGWINNPQQIKPGNLMPPSDFSGPDLQLLLAYLESLK